MKLINKEVNVYNGEDFEGIAVIKKIHYQGEFIEADVQFRGDDYTCYRRFYKEQIITNNKHSKTKGE